jgi:lipoprotein-anchoring transpeptidase ErfK/SrfK
MASRLLLSPLLHRGGRKPARHRVTAITAAIVVMLVAGGAALWTNAGGATRPRTAVAVPRRLTVPIVATTAARQLISATITPGDGDLVGVGMPIVVRFDRPVATAARSVIAGRLEVFTSPAVTGAWRWLTPSELHWRPASYWPAHTMVIASADLDRLDLGDGNWGTGRHVSSFSIGDAHVSTANASTHMMTVTNNGQVERTLPMSAGREQYPSHSGVHVALGKDQSVVMDSASVGIARNAPDGYYETVLWDVRISYGGEFVHAAPWSVAAQGQRNVSHGCINLSPTDAQWFYGFTQRGDIIDVSSAGAGPNLADPGTADWNLSWSAWQTPA